MNENINLCEILKDCPKGTKLYSPLFGDVVFCGIRNNECLPILINNLNNNVTETASFTKDGKYLIQEDGECLLFPSKDQRDWSKFTAPWYKKEKFDPKTLQPFDRVLIKNTCGLWYCNIFSHYVEKDLAPYHCIICNANFCIPYNDDTKHLLGTKDEAPEYYRYWED